MNLETAEALQKIIAADESQAKSILRSMQPEIRTQVIEQFRTNYNLRNLFPEFVGPVTNEN